MQSLDPHQRPPNTIRDVYKKYQRMKPEDLDEDPGIVHIERDLDRHDLPEPQKSKVSIVGKLERTQLAASFWSFGGGATNTVDEGSVSPVLIYEHEDMPGKVPTSQRFSSKGFPHDDTWCTKLSEEPVILAGRYEMSLQQFSFPRPVFIVFLSSFLRGHSLRYLLGRVSPS